MCLRKHPSCAAYILCAESMTRLETDQKAHSANYTGGEKAGQSWTDRVMGVKQTQDTPSSLPQDTQEGVDEDEWVSTHKTTAKAYRLKIPRCCFY